MRQVKRAVKVQSDDHGYWLVVGEHAPTGRRFMWTFLAEEGSPESYAASLAAAKAEAHEMDVFGGPDEWDWFTNFLSHRDTAYQGERQAAWALGLEADAAILAVAR